MEKEEKGERGFTLIEVMVATGLVSIIFLSMLAVLSDYSELFQDASSRNVFITLRRRVIQNLNRRDAWTTTFMAMQFTSPKQNTSFQCLWDINSPGGYPCADNATQHDFVVYNGTMLKPSVVHNNVSASAGYTRRGVPCDTFNQGGTSAGNKRCPIRLRVSWRLLHNGVPEAYYPTGYFPYGYYPLAYWPSLATEQSFWWFGTLGAQVEVLGEFQLNEAVFGNTINLKNYDFRLIKSVP